MIPVPRASRQGIALMVLSGLNAVALLAISLWLITRASAQPPIMYLQMAIVGVRAFALGRAFFRYVGRLVSHESVFKALADVRVSVFERLVKSSPQRLPTRSRAELISTVVRDVDSLPDSALRVTEPLWVNAVVILVTLVTVTVINHVAGIVLVCATALSIAVIVAVDHVVARQSARVVAPLRAELHGIVSERVRFDSVLRAFDATVEYDNHVRRTDSAISRALVAPASVSALGASFATLAMGGVSIAVIALHPVHDPLAFGNISPLFTLVALISLAVVEFIAAIPSILDARRIVAVAQGRLARATSAGTIQAENGEELGAISAIQLNAVTARYEGVERDSMPPVSFSARRGDVVVVRGASGSGKSTLAALLVGFIRPSEGSYRIDGADAGAISAVEIRRRVGLCEQQPHVFAETIRHNLDFANEDASEADLWNVLERVGLAGWARQRDGLETFLGEMGALISGGQAQRIAIARVLLANRDVIVLDEPTANLEPELADELLRDIFTSTMDKIVIILSHTTVPRIREYTEIRLD